MKYFFIFLITTSTFAKNTPEAMRGALSALTELLPYTSSELKFSDPHHEKSINQALEKLTVNFQQAKHSKEIKRPTLEPSYQTLIKQVEDAKVHFSAGNKHYARIKLNQISHLCISCHTQFPEDRLKSQITNHQAIEKVFKEDDFNKANIEFILRDYQKALSSYKKFIKKRAKKNRSNAKTDQYLLPQKQLFDRELYQAVFNSILIKTKVNGDAKEALKYLKNIEREIELPKYVLTEIEKWEDQLRKWTGEVNINKKIKSLKTDSVLDGDHDIDLLMISGNLSKKNYTDPAQLKQNDLLYWMAMTEYRVGKNSFYSLGDIYLKKCIEIYQKTKPAKECFQAYEEEVMFRHTGSSGVFLPQEVKEELKALKSLL